MQGYQSGLTFRAVHHRLFPAVSLKHSLSTLQDGPDLSLKNGVMGVESADHFESASLFSIRCPNPPFGFGAIREPNQSLPSELMPTTCPFTPFSNCNRIRLFEKPFFLATV